MADAAYSDVASTLIYLSSLAFRYTSCTHLHHQDCGCQAPCQACIVSAHTHPTFTLWVKAVDLELNLNETEAAAETVDDNTILEVPDCSMESSERASWPPAHPACTDTHFTFGPSCVCSSVAPHFAPLDVAFIWISSCPILQSVGLNGLDPAGWRLFRGSYPSPTELGFQCPTSLHKLVIKWCHMSPKQCSHLWGFFRDIPILQCHAMNCGEGFPLSSFKGTALADNVRELDLTGRGFFDDTHDNLPSVFPNLEILRYTMHELGLPVRSTFTQLSVCCLTLNSTRMEDEPHDSTVDNLGHIVDALENNQFPSLGILVVRSDELSTTAIGEVKGAIKELRVRRTCRKRGIKFTLHVECSIMDITQLYTVGRLAV